MMDVRGINKISLLLFFLFSCSASADISSFDGSIHKLLHVLNQSKVVGARKCNLFKGSWVKDDSYPLYTDGQCPYVDYKVSCRENGRPDGDYQKWRWKPHACEMPRFNATNMMERLRGKRLMFVGDSISQNQWESLVCLLYPFVKQNTQSPASTKRAENSGKAIIRQFKIPEYKASIEFFWDPLLLEVSVSESGIKVLDLDSIRKFGKRWKNADILVFETSHWWDHVGSERSYDQIKVGGRVLEGNSDPLWAYKKTLLTWSNWVSENLDPAKNMVFFRTMSAKHIDIELDRDNCYNKVKPDKKILDILPIPPQVGIVKRIVKRTKYPVHLLDIARLSSYRIDGHPSVYSKLVQFSKNSDPKYYSDCSHWCLPGVPDTWNELLYTSLLMN